MAERSVDEIAAEMKAAAEGAINSYTQEDYKRLATILINASDLASVLTDLAPKSAEIERLTRERDEARRAWCFIGDLVEPHWRGAGMQELGGWPAEAFAKRGEDYDALDDAAENVVVCYGMGFDLDGVVEELAKACGLEFKPREGAQGVGDLIEALADTASTARTDSAALTSLLRKAQEALKPFDLIASVYDGDRATGGVDGYKFPDEWPVLAVSTECNEKRSMRVGDLREARAVLTEIAAALPEEMV